MKLSLNYPLNLPFVVTQKFGENLSPVYKELGMLGHNGIDYSATDGTPVYAAHDGTVVFAGHDNSAGLGIVIRTNEPFDYNGKPTYFKSIYWHLKEGSVLVKVDERVKAGQHIAGADNTGLSFGSHLHFGLKPVYQGEDGYTWVNMEQTNGYNGAIDPFPYLNGNTPSQLNTNPPTSIPAPTEHPDTLFVAMQKAILAFQLSEGLNDFKDRPLKEVRQGPKTLLAMKRFL